MPLHPFVRVACPSASPCGCVSSTSHPDDSLADVAYTLQVGRAGLHTGVTSYAPLTPKHRRHSPSSPRAGEVGQCSADVSVVWDFSGCRSDLVGRWPRSLRTRASLPHHARWLFAAIGSNGGGLPAGRSVPFAGQDESANALLSQPPPLRRRFSRSNTPWRIYGCHGEFGPRPWSESVSASGSRHASRDRFAHRGAGGIGEGQRRRRRDGGAICSRCGRSPSTSRIDPDRLGRDSGDRLTPSASRMRPTGPIPCCSHVAPRQPPAPSSPGCPLPSSSWPGPALDPPALPRLAEAAIQIRCIDAERRPSAPRRRPHC